VLIFEDIHWAEEPLLELIEHLATWVREAPLLLISLARPELLDIRPGWGGGRVRATAIELEALGPIESEELVDALMTDGPLSEAERQQLLAKTEATRLPRGDRADARRGRLSRNRLDPDTLRR
jgi:predicted ATPase